MQLCPFTVIRILILMNLPSLFCQQQDDPASPTNVQLHFIDVSSVLVSWDYPSKALFTVLVSHDGEPYQPVSEPLNTTQFVYSEMLYSAYYQFRVVAIVGGKESSPAQTNYFVNGITAPPGPPNNVRALIVRPDEVSLEWEAPDTPSPLLYIVHWGLGPQNLNMSKNVVQSTAVGFPGLELNTSYYYTVTASINSWLSIPSTVVMATTPPPYLPGVVVRAAVGVSWALISWSSPPDDRYPLTLTHYIIYSGSAGNDLHPIAQTNPQETSYNITGLDPGSAQLVGVAYSTGRYESKVSELGIETLEGLECVSCRALSSTKLVLEWRVLTNRQGNRTIDVLENEKLLAQVNSKAITGEIVVSGLHPWTGHALTVAIATQTSTCPLLNCWTLEAAPSGPPSAVRVGEVTAESLQVLWSPVGPEERNGIITHYTVGYQCVKRYASQDCQTKQLRVEADKPEELMVVLESLYPWTQYGVVVSASTVIGSGPLSYPLTAVTSQAAPSAGPSGVTASVLGTAIIIHWIPLPLSSRNGLLTSYKILLDQLQHDCHNNSVQIVEPRIAEVAGNASEGLVRGLDACRAYSVQVLATTTAGDGPSSSTVYVTTSPSESLLFVAEFIDCDSLSLTWNWPLDNINMSLNWTVLVYYRLYNGSSGVEVLAINTVVTSSVVSVFASNTTLWLSIVVSLGSGERLELDSPHTTVSPPTDCRTTGPWLNGWLIAVIVVALLLVIAAISLALIITWRNKAVRRPEAEYIMDDLHERAVENDYLLDPSLRISDGQSSESSQSCDEIPMSHDIQTQSCDSEAGSCDSESGSCDTALLDFSECEPLILSKEDSLKENISIRVTPPLAPRQNPDGCSLSDDSSC